MVENPQRRKTESVDPTVDKKMHVVICQRSTIPPMTTQPKTAATLIMMRVRAATGLDAPRVLAYVGR